MRPTPRRGIPGCVRSVPRDRAFTLVELLVVVAIIGALTGLLIPALGSMRAMSRRAACATNLRELHSATMAWAASNKDHLPGINTTGQPYLRLQDSLRLTGNTSPTTPTSVFDWISPTMGDAMGFSPNRAERTAQIFDRLACPDSRRMNNALYGPTSVPDFADFDRIHRSGPGFRQISYLSPASFHLMGKRDTGSPWTSPTGGWHYPYRGPVETPSAYKPRTYAVGAPAAKIWVADGTRYVASPTVLDFDVNPRPHFYGSFTSSGPIYVGSTAYGQDPSQVEFPGGQTAERVLPRSVYPHNARLSYRHSGSIQAMYFDGHMDTLTEKQSRTDARPWYPKGSRFTGIRATSDSLNFHTVGEELN